MPLPFIGLEADKLRHHGRPVVQLGEKRLKGTTETGQPFILLKKPSGKPGRFKAFPAITSLMRRQRKPRQPVLSHVVIRQIRHGLRQMLLRDGANPRFITAIGGQPAPTPRTRQVQAVARAVEEAFALADLTKPRESSTAFDTEGAAGQCRSIVEGGIISGYILGTLWARRLGMRSR